MMEFYTSSELPPMRNKNRVLKSPPYAPEGEQKKVKPPGTADIIPLNYVPFSCRQEEQGQRVCSDRTLEKTLGKQLKLSEKVLQEVEEARRSVKQVFRHTFGSTGMLLNNIFNGLHLTDNRKYN